MDVAGRSFSRFDARYNRLANITADNRLKIWDVSSGKLLQEFFEQKQLTQKFSCLAWGNEISESNNTKPENKIALGTQSGHILIFDLVQAQITTQLGDKKATKKTSVAGHEEGKSVNCLLFSNKGNYLFSGGNDRNIIQWDLASGLPIFRIEVSKREPVFSLGLDYQGAGDLLATGTFSVKLWELSSSKKWKSFVGNSNPVTLLSFKEGFILGCANERFLHLFKVDETGDSQKGKEVAIQEFPCEGKVVWLDFFVNRTEETEAEDKKKKKKKTKSKISINIIIVALTDNNSIHMWKYDPASNEILQSKVSKFSESDSKQQTKILHCAFTLQASNNNSNMNGSSPATAISHDISALLYIDIQGNFKPTFKRVTLSFNTQSTNNNTTNNQNTEIISLLSDITPTPKPVKTASSGTPSTSQKKTSHLDGSLNAAIPIPAPLSFQELLIGADSENAEEPALNSASASATSSSVINNDAEDPAHLPKVESLSNALLQALISKDKLLLEQTLSSTTSMAGKMLVEPTVMKLPPNHVIELLTVLVEKVYSSPQRGAHLILWIQAVLTHHTAYLLTVPNILQALSPLYLLFNSRVKSYKKLLKLNGKLDIILSQAEKRKVNMRKQNMMKNIEEDEEGENNNNNNNNSWVSRSTLVFNEEEEEEEEEEDNIDNEEGEEEGEEDEIQEDEESEEENSKKSRKSKKRKDAMEL